MNNFLFILFKIMLKQILLIKINAIANKAQGKGYENENNYANIQFYFIGIENIHVMRTSLQRMIDGQFQLNIFKCFIAHHFCFLFFSKGTDINNTSGSFLSALEKSEWLKHIKAIIDTSVFIMEAVNDQNVNVVVHCSDGWDR